MGKSNNKLRVLELIAQEGEIARIDIAAATGLSAATVTSLTAELMKSRVLENVVEDQISGAPRGRPRELLRLNPAAFIVAGTKIAVDHITVALMDFNGGLLSESRYENYAFHEKPEELARHLKTAISDAAVQAGLTIDDVSAIGVGIPGFIDGTKRVVHWSPAFTQTPVDLGAVLDRSFNCPVLIDNDANLAAIAERRFGFGNGVSDFLVVTIEHGVGLGIVLNNKLFRGARGVGPEFGHTKAVMNGALCRCGQRGCLEAYVADYALSREADAVVGLQRENGMSDKDHLDALYRAADNGNASAKSIFERAGRVLGTGLANLCNLFDPSLIIFSGDRMEMSDQYSSVVLEELRQNALRSDRALPLIKYHKWGDLLWAKGAAALAADHLIHTSAKT